MPEYIWDRAKDERLQRERRISFDDIKYHLTSGEPLGDIQNPGQSHHHRHSGESRNPEDEFVNSASDSFTHTIMDSGFRRSDGRLNYDAIALIPNPNQERYPGQRLYIVRIDNAAWAVPYRRTGDYVFLYTAYPSDKFTVWWSSLGYGDLDEFEREIEESISGYEILPDPNWEEKKRRIQETARRARSRAYPAGLTEEQQQKFPPGLLAYWRGEDPTPYDDPAAWDEFAKTLTPSDDLWRLAPIDKSADAEPQGQPDTAATGDDGA